MFQGQRPALRLRDYGVLHLFSRLAAILAFIAIALVAAAILYAAFSAFTNQKYTLVDYGKYVNAIWNVGHGNGFQQLTDYNYLNAHLSFSLALLGPAYSLWDHPFTLAVAQWLLCLGGMLIMLRSASRMQLPVEVTGGLLLAYLLSPFTQSVLLSEFHGVSLYLLLLPWLYHCLAFNRRWVLIPLLLLLGVREDAGLLALPMLLFFAINMGWRPGYLLAAGSALYCVFACTLLFEWINGFSLHERRPDIGSGSILDQLRRQPVSWRLLPLGWLLLPGITVLGRGWASILVFPSLALVIAMLSPYKPQFTFANHYAAAAQICLFLGLLHALGQQRQIRFRPVLLRCQAALLVTIALISHLQLGFLPSGGRHQPAYWGWRPDGLAILRAVQTVPSQGILLTDPILAGFAANRQELITWEQFASQRYQPTAILTSLKLLARTEAAPVLQDLDNGLYGVAYQDGVYAVLIRGHDTADNLVLKQLVEQLPRTVRFAYTSNRAGAEQLWQDGSLVRYWPGRGEQNLLSFGASIPLQPGSYKAVFYLQVDQRHNTADGGRLYLMRKGMQAPWLEARIQPGPATACGLFRQQIDFSIDQPGVIEPRVTGGSCPLWLSKVVFEQKRGQ